MHQLFHNKRNLPAPVKENVVAVKKMLSLSGENKSLVFLCGKAFIYECGSSPCH